MQHQRQTQLLLLLERVLPAMFHMILTREQGLLLRYLLTHRRLVFLLQREAQLLNCPGKSHCN
jgi:hypothetical protein